MLPVPARPSAAAPAPPAHRAGRQRPVVDPVWWAEVLLLTVCWGLYQGVRLLVPSDAVVAQANGVALLKIEQVFSLDVERGLNALVNAHRFLALSSDYFYATAHYVLTPVVLVWIYRRHRHAYVRARSVLLVMSMLGLVGFWLLPTMPPRLLGGGFVDTMSAFSAYGWWGTAASAPAGLGDLTNQFAAMPSLHVGWAAWVGACMVILTTRWWLRVLGALYPLVTTVVVIGTANHYVLDAVAGLVVLAASTVLVNGSLRAGRPGRGGSSPAPAPGGGRPSDPGPARDLTQTPVMSATMGSSPRWSRSA